MINMLSIKILLYLSGSFVISQVAGEWHDGSGPWVIATKGEPWPLPNNREVYNESYLLKRDSFKFQVVKENCDILESAIARYTKIVKNEFATAEKLARYGKSSETIKSNEPKGYINNLKIELVRACERYPYLSADESYNLTVPINNNNDAYLRAKSIWGVLRGLETFSQLLTYAENGSGELSIKGQNIVDHPLLSHRGLLLDTSRHYLPVSDILLTLDAMAYNKLNVFHWHIVDDNSFPYESAAFPELSAKGVYHPTMVYTAKDVENIIEYARLRGIRVVPEFDTPGHTKSWGLSHPEFLCQFYDGSGPTGHLGPMDPTQPRLYTFLQRLFGEVTQRFPDKYIHFGGDEVPFDCWQSNPRILEFMKQYNISKKYEKLEELYIQRVLDIADNLKAKSIVWQEVFDNGVNLHNDTVVQIWTGNWHGEMAAVVSAGYPAILSACWYLDALSSGGDWEKFYHCDPFDFRVPDPKQKKLVVGGEACMWGEFVDTTNVHPRIWPRASATAEKLWTDRYQDMTDVKKRMEEHACRMNKRGIPAQPPNGSGFCAY